LKNDKHEKNNSNSSLNIDNLYFFFTSSESRKNKKTKKKGYSLRDFKNNYAVIFDRSLNYGLIDMNGKIVMKTKYSYLSDISEEGHLITGDYIYGFNDGGGAPRIGLKNIKLITLKGDVKKVSNFSDKEIEFLPFYGDRLVRDSYFKVWSKNRIGGVVNSNGNYIINPVYEYISGFNENGYIVAIKENEMFVFDTNGSQINKTPLNYNISLYSPSTTRFPLLKDANNSLRVIDNKVICSSIDGLKYGVFDLNENKFIIPINYDKISSDLFIKNNDTIAYKVYKRNLSTLINYNTHKEQYPYVFEEITDIIEFKGEKFVEGIFKKKLNKKPFSIFTNYTNYINVNTQKLVFPKDLKLYEAKPIDLKYWIVKILGVNKKQISTDGYGIYDVENSSFLEKPILDKYSSIIRLSDKLVLFNKKNAESWLFDLNKKEKIRIFDGQPLFRQFSLSNGQITKSFISITQNRKNTLYDEDFNEVFSDLEYSASYIEEDRYIIKERINGKYVKTAYDIDGKIIGKKYEYKK